MRVETISKNLFTFDELSETAKDNAINNLCDVNVVHEWWKSLYEDAETVCIKITEFDLDRNRYCKTEIQNCHLTAELILKNHGEECETYKTAKTFLDEYLPLHTKIEKAEDIDSRYSDHYYTPVYKKLCEAITSWNSELEGIEEDFKQSITEDYSIVLQKEYEYLTSEEAIKETILANEYEFTENGKIA
jgi:hypothetical protein